jgi:hypothetical protein
MMYSGHAHQTFSKFCCKRILIALCELAECPPPLPLPLRLSKPYLIQLSERSHIQHSYPRCWQSHIQHSLSTMFAFARWDQCEYTGGSTKFSLRKYPIAAYPYGAMNFMPALAICFQIANSCTRWRNSYPGLSQNERRADFSKKSPRL